MGSNDITLSRTDIAILESYKNILDGLAEYLGDGYEIVLHSLENLDRSVIKIINGSHTGRKEGAPITNIALSMLAKISENNGQKHIAYFSKNKNGEPLKASTIAILGEKGNIIGLFCINLYLNTPLSTLLQCLTPSQTEAGVHLSETLASNADELIDKALEQAIAQVDDNKAVGSGLRNKEIVSILYHGDIFKLKQSVEKVAARLEISKNTVYLHLRNLK